MDRVRRRMATTTELAILHGDHYHGVLIDTNDLARVSKHKWNINGRGYVWAKDVGSLHRFILNYNGKLDIDHINRNKLDNRKINLRVTTRTQNNYNQGLRSNNKSGIKGVSWCRFKSKWRAYIWNKGKFISYGYHLNKEDAIKARKDAEKKYIKEKKKGY